MMAIRFVIWTSGWNETMGGVIALHSLCARLNALGMPAALWPDSKPILSGGVLRFARYWPSWWLRGRRRFGLEPFNSLIASASDLADAVVLYPEVVTGNPLGAAHVARWFLHRPGYHTGETGYGERDLHFAYSEAFIDPAYVKSPDRILRVSHINPAYRRTNFGARVGSCYIVRKGAGRTLDQHPADAVRIDEMTHEQKADAFNRFERCYSYDPHTMYTLYAPLCGCTSVYLPDDGETPTGLWPGERPPGLAFGIDDLAWAELTQATVAERVERDLAQEDDMVRQFAETCSAHFANAA